MSSPTVSPLDAEAENISLLGVSYLRLKTPEGGDLYLTPFGAPFREQLSPENWYAPDWFAARRTRLLGTSAIYKVPTRSVQGVSVDLVVRFSRVGQEVVNANIPVEFNSPFEEFSVVMELRAMRPRIFTKKPLAIFVPSIPLELWQTGRAESRIAVKQARNPEVQLDILRQYVLLYGWIEGFNAVQVFENLTPNIPLGKTFLADITRRAALDLEHHGFRMADLKPEHIVLRNLPNGCLLRQRDGQLAYALVDYELLHRF